MRLIDADKLKRKVQRIATEAWMMKINASVETTLNQFIDYIDEAPTIEPKRGEWIFKPTFPNDKSEFPMGSLVCSVCGSHHSNSTPCNYCDNCGARMMKGADNE